MVFNQGAETLKGASRAFQGCHAMGAAITGTGWNSPMCFVWSQTGNSCSKSTYSCLNHGNPKNLKQAGVISRDPSFLFTMEKWNLHFSCNLPKVWQHPMMPFPLLFFLQVFAPQPISSRGRGKRTDDCLPGKNHSKNKREQKWVSRGQQNPLCCSLGVQRTTKFAVCGSSDCSHSG